MELSSSLNVDVYNKTFRELHKFVIENNIKSGFYTVDLTTRAYKTTDLEFQFYCAYFFNSANDNTSINAPVTNYL